MKKSFLGSIMFLFWLGVNSQTKEPLLNDFLSSKEFGKIKGQVRALGEADLALSRVTYVEEDKAKPVLNIAITNGIVVKAVIEAVAIPRTIVNVLPDDARYAMQMIYYDQYDINTKTGTIKMVDLNYDGYTSGQLQVVNGEVKEFLTYPMPEATKAKYAGLKKISEINPGARKPHYCDKNQNGNVGFGECMSCIQQACGGSTTCNAICTIVNIASVFTPIPAQCTLSMGAACVFISLVY